MTAKINQLNIKTEEEAEQVRQFALENEAYISATLNELLGFMEAGNDEAFVIGFATTLCETYVSGLKAGLGEKDVE